MPRLRPVKEAPKGEGAEAGAGGKTAEEGEGPEEGGGRKARGEGDEEGEGGRPRAILQKAAGKEKEPGVEAVPAASEKEKEVKEPGSSSTAGT